MWLELDNTKEYIPNQVRRVVCVYKGSGETQNETKGNTLLADKEDYKSSGLRKELSCL